MNHSSDVQDRYTQILERFAQELKVPKGAADRRAAPRVPVSTKAIHAVVSDLGLKADIDVETKDISTSGVCFFADRPFQLGSEVELTVSKVFSLTAAVVSCEMEETDANLLEVRYRVRCRFTDQHHGMELLVLAKEAEMAGEMGPP